MSLVEQLLSGPLSTGAHEARCLVYKRLMDTVASSSLLLTEEQGRWFGFSLDTAVFSLDLAVSSFLTVMLTSNKNYSLQILALTHRLYSISILRK